MSQLPRPAFSLSALRAGFEACAQNALRLLATARKCVEPSDSTLWQENFALGLSLAVLALEEVGKFCLIDATIFSYENDEVLREVRGKHTGHKSKLDYLQVWPLIINHIAEHGRQPTADSTQRLHLAASISKCKSITAKMESWIPGLDFTLLDQWKQRGFYVSMQGAGFQAPPDAITRARAEEVVSLAHAVVQATVEHGLANIDRYLAWVADQRALLTPAHLEAIRQALRDTANGGATP